MQHWQIKALKLEVSALKHLDGVLAGHELYISVVLVYLLTALGVCLIVLLCCGRRKPFHVRPVIFVQIPGPPPPQADTFDPFPPPHYHPADCDCDDD